MKQKAVLYSKFIISLFIISIIFYQMPSIVVASETGPKNTEASDSDFDFIEQEKNEKIIISDPLSSWNRLMFQFNDRLYFWVLKPAAKGYKTVMPLPVRKGIKNFFYNIRMPIRFANCILQGKGHYAMAEYSRFIINSTAGFGGFLNPAEKYPWLNPSEEDFGQTLGHYGIGNGIYLVWPFFGPSTIRDTIGLTENYFLDPVYYVKPAEAVLGLSTFEMINNTSLRIGDYESLKDSAINPYEAFRDAYLQYRKGLVEK
jgi:phospholipid-binding lipoprotein MlaA